MQTDDCSGQFCVPAELYPVEHAELREGPSLGRVDESCGPTDGPAIDIVLDDQATLACGDAPSPTQLRFTLDTGTNPGAYFFEFGAGVIAGSYDANGDGSITPDEFVQDGAVVLESTAGGLYTGRYELSFGGVLVHGSFSELGPACPLEQPCG